MLNRKDKIIISAIELLDEDGIAGVTIKNIAKKQKVTEPALYRQFQSKQEIINSIMEEFGYYDQRIQETIQQSDLKGREALLFYVRRYAELYENYSELTTVLLSMDVYFYQAYTKGLMTKVIMDRKKFLILLVEQSRDALCFSDKMTPAEIASVIQGTIFAQIYEWRLSEKSYSLHEMMMKLFENML